MTGPMHGSSESTDGLEHLLAGRTPPGVYRWHSSLSEQDAAAAAERAGWRLARLGRVVDTREEALAALGETLGFPEHYGRNLDALWDCLRDLPAPTILLWDGWGRLARSAGSDVRRLLGVLGDRAAQGGFAVLLRGDGPDLGIPVLD